MNPAKWWALQNGGNINDYRECIYGFPCRLILVNDGTTPLNEGQEEPSPGNTKDMGIFNFNLDKDCPNSLGFAIEDFPNVMSFEVTANSDTSAGAFISYANWNGDKSTVSELDYLLQSFEVRYNKYDDDTFGILDVNGDTNLGLKRIVDFVDNSTDEEFVNNFEEYFLKDYTLRYYILVIVLGMVDNLGKNCMWDSYDGKIFMPRFYDCDTICSYDNSGAIKFDVDIEMAQGYWNTSSSRLWTRVRDLFHDELVETYKNMRQNGMSYESFMSYFYDEQISMIPQRYYNMDYDVKYAPYSTEYMGKAHGNGYEHLKRWLKNRLIFTDTLFDYAPAYTNDMLTIRANTDQPMSLTIETYTPVYQHLSWYNGNMEKEKIAKGTSFTFTGTAQASTDQEVLIYGGSNIKRITGISSMNPDSMLIGSATRLVELEVTDCPILTDINSSKANLEAHTYLSKLDLSNCPQLGGTLRVNQSPLLREINIQGTAITNLQLPSSIRNLEKLQLPSAITDLTLNDAPLLKSLYFEGENSLTSVSMTNCNNLTDVINFDLTQVPKVILNNSYDTEELYMSKTTNLTLNNMKNLKRLIYIPNEEIEEFNLSNLMSASEYVITTFNCPNLTDFITTSQQRLSYGLESDGNIYPNKVFMASLLNLSNTQFTNIKFLCTTDLYKLMLPTTVKNFYCDSAFDLDTSVVADGDYDVIHGDLIEPYTTNYESNVYHGSEEVSEKIIWNAGNISNIYPSLNHGDHYSQQINVIPNTDFSLEISTVTWCRIYGFDDSDAKVWAYGGNSTTDTTASSGTFPSNVTHIRIAGIGGASNNLTYQKPYTPNIVSTSANGSLIYNVWSQLGTQPSSTSPYIWDLTGLKFNDFHTYGMNNWVKTDENGNITMPQRTTGYSVRLQNADITPNNYNTMLYPLFIDTTLPIVGKLDYSKYKGNNLSWAFAYTTDDVVRTPMDSRDMGNIKYDYNKLYSTDYVDIVDVWIYKDSDCSNLSTNENITKAYIELTQDNYKTRIDEVLQWYPNCTDLYLFDDGSVTTLENMFYYNNETYKSQIVNITFIENYFNNLTALKSSFREMTNLISVNNIPNSVNDMSTTFHTCTNLKSVSNLPSNLVIMYLTFYSCINIENVPTLPNTVKDLRSTFNTCKKLNQEFDLSQMNINDNQLTETFNACISLTYTPILPSDYTGTLQGAFSQTKITTAPVLPNGVTSLYIAFKDCSELTTVGNIPTSCTDFERFVNDCPKITSVPQEGWKGNLNGTFWNAPLLNQQINIESTTSLDNTFKGCNSLSITPQLPQKVNCSMTGCFRGCVSLVISPVTPQGVTIMSNCYNGCTSLTSAPNIPSSCKDIRGYLSGCTGITEVTIPLNVITQYANALSGCSGITNITWTGTRTTDFSLTDLGCPTYKKADIKELVNEHLGTVDSATLTMNSTCLGYLTVEEKATGMMKGWSGLEGSTIAHIPSDLDVSTLTSDENIKNCVIELTSSNYTTRLDDVISVYPNYVNVFLYGDDTVTSLYGMCNNANGNNNPNSRTKIKTVTFLRDGFKNVIDLSNLFVNTNITTFTFNNIKIKYMHYMFQGCRSLTKVNTNDMDLSNCTRMDYSFKKCIKLTTLDVSKWDTGKITTIQEAFYDCSSLTTLDISNWKFSSMTNFQRAFYSLSNVEVLNFSNANLSKVTTLTGAFINCSKLKELILGGSSTTIHSCSYFNGTFSGCTSLTKLNLSKFKSYNITQIDNFIYNCISLTDIVPFSADGGGLVLSHDLSTCTSLSASELVEWINSLATVTDSPTLTLGEQNLAKLTDEQKALATNKGWTLA